MTRVRLDLFLSLDGFTSSTKQSAENPMGEDWGVSQRTTPQPARSANTSSRTAAALAPPASTMPTPARSLTV
ncbi:hypothetical protein NHF46_08875 [Arthrobacter alpinus]|nr:hypothetical protein [Arthrobacter alpinus]